MAPARVDHLPRIRAIRPAASYPIAPSLHHTTHAPPALQTAGPHSTRRQWLTLRMLALRVVLSHPRVAGPHSGPEIWCDELFLPRDGVW